MVVKKVTWFGRGTMRALALPMGRTKAVQQSLLTGAVLRRHGHQMVIQDARTGLVEHQGSEIRDAQVQRIPGFRGWAAGVEHGVAPTPKPVPKPRPKPARVPDPAPAPVAEPEPAPVVEPDLVDERAEALREMGYNDLRAKAKRHDVSAGGGRDAIIERLLALEGVDIFSETEPEPVEPEPTPEAEEEEELEGLEEPEEEAADEDEDDEEEEDLEGILDPLNDL